MVLDEVVRRSSVTSDRNDSGVQTTKVLGTKTLKIAAETRAKVQTPTGGNRLHDDSDTDTARVTVSLNTPSGIPLRASVARR